MLSTAVIVGLQEEEKQLIAERLSIDERLDAIRKLLGSVPPPVAAALPVTKPVQPPPPWRVSPPEDFFPVEPEPLTTVKAVVKDALRARPGAKAAMVTRILRQRGFKPGGATRISHRVYNEIWRMVKSGEAVRTEDGGFKLVE